MPVATSSAVRASHAALAAAAHAEDVISYASEAKETDWLHRNDLANSGTLANGFVGLIVGNLWIMTSGSGSPFGRS